VGTGRHLFAFAIHHIVSDAWSIMIFADEVRRAYRAARRGVPAALPPLPMQARDYAAWVGAMLSSGRGAELEAFWRRALAGRLRPVALPARSPRDAGGGYEGRQRPFRLPEGLGDELVRLARERKTTLFSVALAVYFAALYRYTEQRDLIVGTPVSMRDDTRLEGQIGFYVNLVPVRARLEPGATFGELLGLVGGALVEAFEHGAYPVDRLLGGLDVERRGDRLPLTAVGLTLHVPSDRERASLDSIERGGLDVDISLRRVPLARTQSRADFWVFLEGERFTGHVEYASGLYAPEFVDGFVAAYAEIARQVAAAPDTRLDRIALGAGPAPAPVAIDFDFD
jgi:tyrocidine synthetase-3